MTKVLLAALVLLVAAGCGGSSTDGSAPAGESGGNIRLVAYSTPRDAYAKLIDLYRSGKGEGVEFDQSYGSSGEQNFRHRGISTKSVGFIAVISTSYRRPVLHWYDLAR